MADAFYDEHKRRPRADDRHLEAVPRHEVLAQLGQELSGGPVVGPVRAVEEADHHAALSMTVAPSTSASMRVRKKQSSASSGVRTLVFFLMIRRPPSSTPSPCTTHSLSAAPAATIG